MKKKLLVIQHTPWETPGRFLLAAAKQEQVLLRTVKAWKEPIPDPTLFAGLVVLGGSPNVSRERLYPFLAEEKKIIRRSIDQDRPYLGICLGHQLLAEALGAMIGDNFRPSIGFVNGFLTLAGREHPIFENVPKKISLLKWHSQTVLEPLPAALEPLATSMDCQVEALSVKGRPHLVGLQFDTHAAAPENLASWLDHDSKWLASLAIDFDPGSMLLTATAIEPILKREFVQIFHNFCRFLQ